MKKLLAISFIPGLVMAIFFVLWGDFFEEWVKPSEFNKTYDLSTAWIIALSLMVSDLFLPIPASALMTAIGAKYGFLLGFSINVSGLLLAGLTAYAIARFLGRKKAGMLCSEKELAEYGAFFNKWGGASIIISRALPILPEVTSLMAGFAGMNFKKYLLSLLAGSVPVALLYSWLGITTADEPAWGMAVAVSIPLLLWIPVNSRLSRAKHSDEYQSN